MKVLLLLLLLLLLLRRKMSETQIHELENAVLERCHPHGAVVHVWVDKKSPVVCILSVYSLSILSQYSPVYSLSILSQYTSSFASTKIPCIPLTNN